MLGEERRRWMLNTLAIKGALSVAEAERALPVSRMTVHRDLDVLVTRGLVRKVHGGVVAVHGTDRRPFDPRAQPFEDRLAVRTDAKRVIARHVAGLVARARTLVLDASSTVYGLAALLDRSAVRVPAAGAVPAGAPPAGFTPAAATSAGVPPRDAGVFENRELFIVTGGLPLFGLLVRQEPGIRVALHGGEPHPRTGSLVGPLALASLREMRFDFAVISALGLLPDEGTVFISNPDEAEVKCAYLDRSRRAILAVDSSKLGQSGAYKLGGLDRFDHVVTEQGVFTPAEMKNATRKRARR